MRYRCRAQSRRCQPSSSRLRRQKYTKRGPDIKPILVTKRGLDLVHDPLYNKGTGYDMPERDRLGLRGLVPPRMLDMEVRHPATRDNASSYPSSAAVGPSYRAGSDGQAVELHS